MTAAEHLIRAREAVRLAISISRQIEQHAIYLNQDNLDYMRDVAAAARVQAREHIRKAARANQTRKSGQSTLGCPA